MVNDGKKLKINLCLGSSCFSRGSKNALEPLEEYVRSQGLEEKVSLSGSLCKNECKDGPNMTVNGKLYGHIDPAAAIDILKHHIRQLDNS